MTRIELVFIHSQWSVLPLNYKTRKELDQVKGIEPSLAGWKPAALPIELHLGINLLWAEERVVLFLFNPEEGLTGPTSSEILIIS